MKKLTKLLVLSGLLALAGNAQAEMDNTLAATDKVPICHKGKTIRVATSAVPAHLRHGDIARPCEIIPRAVALFRCGGQNLTILSISKTVGLPDDSLAPDLLNVGGSCAGSIRLLMNHGFKRMHANTILDSVGEIVTDYGFSGPQVNSTAP